MSKLDDIERIERLVNKQTEKYPEHFWCGIYDNPDGLLCCFNHWVGLPERWGKRHPIYDYQEEIIEALKTKRYIWILKAPKLGITELFLRYALWKSLTDPIWKDGQVAVIVATKSDEAETLIQRAKKMLDGRANLKEGYNNKREFTVNSVAFKIHSADNIDSVRSKTNMRMIIIDEGSFFRMIEQSRVREAVEHYIAASDLYIVFISTAGESPEGVMYEIQEEENSIYHKIFLPYELGLKPDPRSGTMIYDPELIKQAQNSRSFARNYMLSWISGEGNIFTHEEVDYIYEDFETPDGQIIISIDPAYGSSNFGVVVGVLSNGILHVIFAKEYNRSTPTFMCQEVEKLYHIYNAKMCICDGHYSGEMRDLTARGLNVIPFEMNTENKSNMVTSTSERVQSKKIKILKRLKDLGGQMKASKTDAKGHLDKHRMNLDMLECLMMICERIKTSKVRIIKV
ncbi:MAG TPA: hypothetical protein VLE21_04755 [Candidatus Nitrosocosmicus sp.]|nr:hypothetical protein [Candidatus Nitrosocosmicus sp.]